MMFQRIAMAAGLVAVTAAPALAQKTTYDFDKTAVFAQYKTYALREGTPVKQPLDDQRITSAIEAQMAKKGFTKVASGEPDVYVIYHVALDQEKDISTWSTGTGYGPYGYGWGGGWGTTTTDVRVRDITVGTLAVDLVDAKKKQMVWRGLGTKEIDTNAKPEKRENNINKAVEKIFKNYPPKVKK
jgi:hypothetical protein